MIPELIFTNMYWIKVAAVVLTIFSIWLTSRNNRHCWPVGLLGIICYMVYYFESQILMNTLLQIIFIVQSVFGWWRWKHIPKEIRTTDRNLMPIVISMTILVGFMLWVLNSILEGNNPVFDSITTTLSLMGMMMTADRRLEAWYFWILTNIFYIIMFYNQGEPLLMTNYLINLPLSIFGYFDWKDQMRLKSTIWK